MACIDLTACCQGEKSHFSLPALTSALAALWAGSAPWAGRGNLPKSQGSRNWEQGSPFTGSHGREKGAESCWITKAPRGKFPFVLNRGEMKPAWNTVLASWHTQITIKLFIVLLLSRRTPASFSRQNGLSKTLFHSLHNMKHVRQETWAKETH